MQLATCKDIEAISVSDWCYPIPSDGWRQRELHGDSTIRPALKSGPFKNGSSGKTAREEAHTLTVKEMS